MNILVIGNGGREHAVIQALKKSPKAEKIYAMKGNAGIAELAEPVDVDYCDIGAVGDWLDDTECSGRTSVRRKSRRARRFPRD